MTVGKKMKDDVDGFLSSCGGEKGEASKQGLREIHSQGVLLTYEVAWEEQGEAAAGRMREFWIKFS